MTKTLNHFQEVLQATEVQTLVCDSLEALNAVKLKYPEEFLNKQVRARN